MDAIIDYFQKHYTWIFSGIGGTVILVIGKKVISKVTNSSNKVVQKNITAGGDVVGRDKK